MGVARTSFFKTERGHSSSGRDAARRSCSAASRSRRSSSSFASPHAHCPFSSSSTTFPVGEEDVPGTRDALVPVPGTARRGPRRRLAGTTSRRVRLLSTRGASVGARCAQMVALVATRWMTDARGDGGIEVAENGRLVPVSSWTDGAFPRRSGARRGGGAASRRRWSVDSGERNAREGGDVGDALEGDCSRRASRASRRASSKRRRRRSTSGGWRTSRETAEGPRWRVDARKGGARFAPR